MRNIFLLIAFFFYVMLTAESYAQKEIKFELPVLISSAGQSADVKLAELLFKKQKIESKTISMAKPKDLAGMKTLVVVPGFSSKGLGAAGISADDEMKRVKTLLAEAKVKKIPVVLLHIGGKARRKGQSDNFIKLVAEAAKYMIVVEQGNEDKLFTELSNSSKIPLVLVKKIPDAGEPLGNLFK